MNMPSTVRTIIAAVMVFSLGMTGTALAGDRSHGYRDSGHYSGHHSKHQSKHQYKRSYRGHGRHSNNYYRYDDDGDDLLIGLVVGGILGYAINSAQHHDDTGYDSNTYSHNAYPATDTYRYSDSSCLQEREYQTKVIVGGRSVDAYGTACLQPDGSWSRGPAELASY